MCLYLICPTLYSTYTSFVPHFICPASQVSYISCVLPLKCPAPHLSYTSFILQFIFPTPHLAYTSFVLHLIFSTPHYPSSHVFYTSLVLYNLLSYALSFIPCVLYLICPIQPIVLHLIILHLMCSITRLSYTTYCPMPYLSCIFLLPYFFTTRWSRTFSDAGEIKLGHIRYSTNEAKDTLHEKTIVG